MRRARASLALALLLAPPGAAAQTPSAALNGQALAALLPASLGGATRSDVHAYGSFATASYGLASGDTVALQYHDVVGAGSEAYQRSVCPRFVQLAGHRACVTPRAGRVSVSWVLDDRIQVILGAPDEATALRLAAACDLAPLARLAARR